MQNWFFFVPFAELIMKTLSFFAFFLTCITLCAQKKLVFRDTVRGKTVVVKPGDKVKLLYNGYLGQLDAYYGTTGFITDSLVRLDSWVVRVGDIRGFRKFNRHRETWQGITRVATFLGSLVLINRLYANNPDIGLGKSIGISLGIGLANYGINAALFPSRIKNHNYNGWTVAVED